MVSSIPYSTSRPKTMADIIRDVEKNPIHASRVEINLRQLNGKHDGASVVSGPQVPLSLPKTGLDAIDVPAQKVLSLTRFGPNAAKRTIGSVLRNASLGAIIGLPVGLFLRRNTLLTVFTAQRKTLWRYTPDILATVGVSLLLSVGGAIFGFAKAMFQNARELFRIIFGPGY